MGLSNRDGSPRARKTLPQIVKNTKARFVVQHDVKDVAALPKLPAYLE